MPVQFLRGIRRVCAALALCAGLALTASPALAIGPGSGPVSGGGSGPDSGGGGAGGGGGSGPQNVPEIDPRAAVSALLLLAGGSLILIDRVRRRPAPPTHVTT